MRTIPRVDMARKESNTTDENSVTELLHVYIRPPLAEPKAIVEQPRPRQRLPQDIHRYFQPKQRQNFDIRCDETATPDEPIEAGASSQVNSLEPTNRPPLRPLNESEVNKLQAEGDSVSEFSDSEPEVPRPYRERLGGLDTPFATRNHNMIGRVELLQRAGSAIPLSANGPFASSSVFEDPLSSLRTNEHAVLPTPPSSDPIRGEIPSNPPYQPHGRQAALVPRPIQTQRSNVLGTAFAAANGLGQMAVTSIPERVRTSIGQEMLRLPDLVQKDSSPFVFARG